MKITEVGKGRTNKFGNLSIGDFFIHPDLGFAQKLASTCAIRNTLLLPGGAIATTAAVTTCVLVEVTEITYCRK